MPASPSSPSKDASPDKGIAFSSFAHIHDLQALEFAVVLREDGNGEDIVSRMLPMSRIVPGEKKEKEKRVPKPPKVDTKTPCPRPECVANKNRIQEMQDVNLGLMEQLEDLDAAIRGGINKLEEVDKQNKAAEDANEELEGQMQEIDQQAATLEIEAEDGLRQKRDLLNKVKQLEAEIEMYEKQAEERRQQMENAMKATTSEVVFGAGRGGGSLDATLTQSLDLWNEKDTAAQGNFLANLNRPKTTPGRIFKMPAPEYMKNMEKARAMSRGGKSGGGGRTRSKTLKTASGGEVKAF